MLDQRLQFGREPGQSFQLGLEHLQLDDHVTEQLPASGIGKGSVVSQFMNFADIVEKRSREEQVTINLRVIPAHQVAGAEERNNVIEQPTDVRVVQGLGRRSGSVRNRHLWIVHEGLNQAFQVWVFEAVNKLRQRAPELVNVFGGFREIICELYFYFVQAPQLVDRQLEAVVVLVDQAFDFDEVVLLEAIDAIGNVVPHLGFDLSGAVRQRESEVGFTGFFRLDLFYSDDKAGNDDLIFVLRRLGDIKVFHRLDIVPWVKLSRVFWPAGPRAFSLN